MAELCKMTLEDKKGSGSQYLSLLSILFYSASPATPGEEG